MGGEQTANRSKRSLFGKIRSRLSHSPNPKTTPPSTVAWSKPPPSQIKPPVKPLPSCQSRSSTQRRAHAHGSVASGSKSTNNRTIPDNSQTLLPDSTERDLHRGTAHRSDEGTTRPSVDGTKLKHGQEPDLMIQPDGGVTAPTISTRDFASRATRLPEADGD